MKNKIIMIGAGVVALGVVIWVAMNMKSEPAATKNQNTNMVESQVPEVTTLTLKEHSFTPTEFTAGASQTIKVKLVNDGTTGHALVFDTLDFNSGVVDPGQSKTVTFTTPSAPGRYNFHCDQVDHRSKGMTGTMIVQ